MMPALITAAPMHRALRAAASGWSLHGRGRLLVPLSNRDKMLSCRGVPLDDADYAQLLALRTGLRHFERWSEQQARSVGLTPGQHQLVLAVRGHGDRRGPTVGEVADYLLLRHHSAVGLIDRAEDAGLLTRHREADDHRVVRLQLTRKGIKALERLSAAHLEELERIGPEISRLWEGIGLLQLTHGLPARD